MIVQFVFALLMLNVLIQNVYHYGKGNWIKSRNDCLIDAIFGIFFLGVVIFWWNV